MSVLYEVAVDAPLATTLTYSQPAGRTEPLPAGCCVRVPLGNRRAIGYILGIASLPAEDAPSFVVKPIEEVLGETPFFPESLIPFYRWVGRYYHHPIGEVLRTALPMAPTSRRNQQVAIKLRETLSPAASLNLLLKAGCTAENEKILTGVEEQWGVTLKKAERRALSLVLDLHRQGNGQPVPRSLVNQQYPGVGPRLNRLVALDILAATQERVYRDPFGEPPVFHPMPEQLTAEQQQVLAVLLPAVRGSVFAPFLLFGVTGCGKTEVYLRVVQQALDAGKTALVLVPEIALATQLEAHFHSRFGGQLAVLHSGLGDGERLDQWQSVLARTAKVVLGARSAVFAPLEQLGIVIVDEEHEPAYKQEEGLRYNGRDLAVLRAQMAGCPVLLGSATPSVVSYHHCMQGKYTLLTMRSRVAQQPLPAVGIVDLATVKRSRPDLVFSDQLITAIGDTLEQGKQSLLFVNRRGFSSFMLCRDCGAILQCKHCQVSLTLHRSQQTLLCHYCGYRQHPGTLCPSCGSTRMAGLGIGSERVEEEVRQLFPEARVARLDSDTTANRKRYLAVLKAVRTGQIDILIGTQMIAKGLHFPDIILVGVVWADSGLGMPDYKAAERTFSLLAQVTGRAGRGESPGRVIIQTYQPHHYCIELAQQHDYPSFFDREIATRQPLGYPPFSRLINIRFSGLREKRVEGAARGAADFLRQHHLANRLTLLGPSPSPLAKLKDRSRWQLLLKSPYPVVLHQACDTLLAEKAKLCPHGVTMHFDVDPENMM